MAFDRIDNGGVQVEIRWRSDVPAELRADLDRFFAHPEVLELGGRAERLELAPGAGRCTLQHLRQVDARPDAEAEIHTDTFQPTHKLWLYLTDVAPEDGPLCYYPRSHRLRWRSLVGTYRESIGANEGSRRVPDRELARSRPGLLVHSAIPNALASIRAARPRCEMAFFWPGVSSAMEVLIPRGMNTGSYPNPCSPRGSVAMSPGHTPHPAATWPSALTATSTHTNAARRSATPSSSDSRRRLLSSNVQPGPA